MDLRGVIFLSFIIAQATSAPVDNGIPTSGPIKKTIRKIRNHTQQVLGHCNASGLNAHTSCDSVDLTELSGMKEPGTQLTRQHLSVFRCYMMEARALVPELSDNLTAISQCSLELERLLGSDVTENSDANCTIPEMDAWKNVLYVKCLLQDFAELLKKNQ